MADKYVTDLFGKRTRVSKSIADKINSLFGLSTAKKMSNGYSVEVPLFTSQQYEQYKEYIDNLLAQTKSMISPRIFLPKEHALVTNRYVYDYIEHKLKAASGSATIKEMKAEWAKPFGVKVLTLPVAPKSNEPLLYAGKSGMSLVRSRHNVYGAVASLAGFQTNKGKIIPLSANINAKLRREKATSLYPYFEVYVPAVRGAYGTPMDKVKNALSDISQSYAGNTSEQQLQSAKDSLQQLINEGIVHKFGINLSEWSKLKREALLNAPYDSKSFLQSQFVNATAVARMGKWSRAVKKHPEFLEQLKAYKAPANTVAFDVETLSTGSILQFGTSKAGTRNSMLLRDTYEASELTAPPPITEPGYLGVLNQAISGKANASAKDVTAFINKLKANVEAGKTKLLGYNVLGFDFKQLANAGLIDKGTSEYLEKHVVDVYSLMQKYAPVVESIYNTKFPNLRLTSVAQALGVANAKQIASKAHSAEYDAWLTERVYNKISFVETLDISFVETLDKLINGKQNASFTISPALVQLLLYEHKFSTAYDLLGEVNTQSMSYSSLSKTIDALLRKSKYKATGAKGLMDFSRGVINVPGQTIKVLYEASENASNGKLVLKGETIGETVEGSFAKGTFDLYSTILKHATPNMKKKIEKSLKTGYTVPTEQMLSDFIQANSIKFVAQAEQNMSNYYNSVSNVLYNADVPKDILNMSIPLDKIINVSANKFDRYIENTLEYLKSIDSEVFLPLESSNEFIREMPKAIDISKMLRFFENPNSVSKKEANDILHAMVQTLGKLSSKYQTNIPNKLEPALRFYNERILGYGLTEKELISLLKFSSLSSEQVSMLEYPLKMHLKEVANYEDEIYDVANEVGLNQADVNVLAKLISNIDTGENTEYISQVSGNLMLENVNPSALGNLPEETFDEIKSEFRNMLIENKYTNIMSSGDIKDLYRNYLRNVRGFMMANSMAEMKYSDPSRIAKEMYKPGTTSLKKVLSLAKKYIDVDIGNGKLNDFRDYAQAMIENEINGMFSKASKENNVLAAFIKELNSSNIFNIFDEMLSLSDKLSFAMYYLSNPQYAESAYKDIDFGSALSILFTGEPEDIESPKEMQMLANETIQHAQQPLKADVLLSEAHKIFTINGTISRISKLKTLEEQFEALRKEISSAPKESRMDIIEAGVEYFGKLFNEQKNAGKASGHNAKLIKGFVGKLHSKSKSLLKENTYLHKPVFVESIASKYDLYSINDNNAEQRLIKADSEFKSALQALRTHKTNDAAVEEYVKDVNNAIVEYEKMLEKNKAIPKFLKDKYKLIFEGYKNSLHAEMFAKTPRSKAGGRNIQDSIFGKMIDMSSGKSVRLNSNDLLIIKALVGDSATISINGKNYKLGTPITIKLSGKTSAAVPLVDEDGKVLFMGSNGKILSEDVSQNELPRISAQLQKQSYVLEQKTEEGKIPKVFEEAVNLMRKQKQERMNETLKKLSSVEEHLETIKTQAKTLCNNITKSIKEYAEVKAKSGNVSHANSKMHSNIEHYLDETLQNVKSEAEAINEYNEELAAGIKQAIENANKEQAESITDARKVSEKLYKVSEKLYNAASNAQIAASMHKAAIREAQKNTEEAKVTPDEIAQAISKIIKDNKKSSAARIEDGVKYYNRDVEKLISKESLKNATTGTMNAIAKLLKSAKFWKGVGIVAAISGGLYALSYTATKGTSKDDIHRALKAQVSNSTRYNQQLIRDFSFVMTPYGVDIDYYADSDSEVNYPTNYINALDLDRTSIRR